MVLLFPVVQYEYDRPGRERWRRFVGSAAGPTLTGPSVALCASHPPGASGSRRGSVPAACGDCVRVGRALEFAAGLARACRAVRSPFGTVCTCFEACCAYAPWARPRWGVFRRVGAPAPPRGRARRKEKAYPIRSLFNAVRRPKKHAPRARAPVRAPGLIPQQVLPISSTSNQRDHC